MYDKEIIPLTRDCDAVLVPAGTPILLPEGTQVSVMQSLGGTFTVYVNGNLARIEGKDADALDKTIPAEAQEPKIGPDETVTEDTVWGVLKTCYDPEIPVNIVDLGLIYKVGLKQQESTEQAIDIEMTLTAPGCGFGPIIISEIETRLGKLPGVSAVNVELVFDPPWGQEMMSEEAKLQLNMF